MSPPVRLVSIVLCALLFGCSGAAAQSFRAHETPFTSAHDASPAETTARPLTTIGSPTPNGPFPLRPSGLAVPPARTSPPFKQALLGSSLGLAVGGPLGILLIRASRDDSVWESAEEHKDDCCGLQRLGVGLLGVSAIAGSGPYGAATRLGKSGVNVYSASVTTELLLGSLGYGLGSGLGDTDRQKRILSLSLGLPLAAVGAALGAVLADPNGASSHAALTVKEGRWSIGVPQIRLQPHATIDRSPVVHVSLLSAEL